MEFYEAQKIVRQFFSEVIEAQHPENDFTDDSTVSISLAEINELMRKIQVDQFAPIREYTVNGFVQFLWSVTVKAPSSEEAQELVENNMPEFSCIMNNESDYLYADVDAWANETEIDSVEDN